MRDADNRHTTPRTGRLDAVGLPWLVSVRWAGVIAQAGAVVAGAQGLAGAGTRLAPTVALIGVAALSNVWLSWRSRRRRPLSMPAGGWLVCADIVMLSWLLHDAGGVLNPGSIFFLVYIVLAGLVLDRAWAWIVTTVSIVAYGLLYLTQPAELAAAGSMHPEIGLHVRGMWLAFAVTALLVAALVARLASLIERRDRTLAELRERASRDARLVAMTTLSAGAAHELSTPLATIAVAARELDLALERAGLDSEYRDDARLIRAEVERCRRLLQDMSAQLSQPIGEGAVATSVAVVMDATMDRIAPAHRARIRVSDEVTAPVVWPVGVIARALVNVVENALQASPSASTVSVAAAIGQGDRVIVTVHDRGSGMRADVLARAGEPFYTTKPQGGGTGLGLFVARSTMEQLGGSLTITSQVSEGTTVTMTLPADVSQARRDGSSGVPQP